MPTIVCGIFYTCLLLLLPLV